MIECLLIVVAPSAHQPGRGFLWPLSAGRDGRNWGSDTTPPSAPVPAPQNTPQQAPYWSQAAAPLIRQPHGEQVLVWTFANEWNEIFAKDTENLTHCKPGGSMRPSTPFAVTFDQWAILFLTVFLQCTTSCHFPIGIDSSLDKTFQRPCITIRH